ncbi:hypothetical protein CQA53_07500 [Helicobacter didelphidarum]|uniref:Uncharacterized protein n=1 Tax=Helicobacter didelphidarum TaxID=2040648 RepID=A0A3D8IJ38_9HELI|nr:C4-type zinc ribbon domain-containing protein [Helicobacter didelphidarum]RDU64906.1 hypothetical protein CQA53_07500 [Helicobacter didelphidarum]
MNENLKKLIEVNQLDLEVSKYNPLIEEKKAPMYAKMNEKTQAEKEKIELEAGIVSKQDTLTKSNEEFNTISTEIEKIRERLKDSKSEKEMKNLSMEEDILREKMTAFNNEIERLEREIAHAQEKIITLTETIQQLNNEIEQIELASSNAVGQIKQEQDEVSAKRRAVALEMDPALLRLYEKIRKWAGNSSVTPIYKNACAGCFIKLNNKNLVDIEKGHEIIHCPHCGRILFDPKVFQEIAQ